MNMSLIWTDRIAMRGYTIGRELDCTAGDHETENPEQ